MKKYGVLLLILAWGLLLVGCNDDAPGIGGKEDPGEEEIDLGYRAGEEPDIEEDESFEEMLERMLAELLPEGESFVSYVLTSDEMRAFEAENAVTEAQARYLAFGAFVLTNNRESIRVFALSGSHNAAARILSDFWSVDCHESAMRQLVPLAYAEAQGPVADDIFNTFVRNGRLEPINELDLYRFTHDLSGLENIHAAAQRRAEGMPDEFERLKAMLEVSEAEEEEAFEVFVLLQMANRINQGLEAYQGAKAMLVDVFGFTEEELLAIPTLAAWDFGRTAIIARYGVAAGYLEENEAWEYLKKAADNAAEIYSDWREYTAAHILGRALAFGNPSLDFEDSLRFLLEHEESPFLDVSFKGA